LRAPDNELISGKVAGVGNSGELILDVAGTKRSFLSGEVQMQRVESS
jgi:biotin-(acetyl-CoA carboxylase) ligase